jgi:hypothetical protein
MIRILTKSLESTNRGIISHRAIAAALDEKLNYELNYIAWKEEEFILLGMDNDYLERELYYSYLNKMSHENEVLHARNRIWEMYSKKTKILHCIEEYNNRVSCTRSVLTNIICNDVLGIIVGYE